MLWGYIASADTEQMERAKHGGIVQAETPIFVKNKLVIIVPRQNPGKVKAFRDLTKPGLKLDLAAAAVPAGYYSRLALDKASADSKDDFAQRVLRNVVSEEGNVERVVKKVRRGETDAGIVYSSDITQQISKDVLTIPVPDGYNQIATYPIAVTREVRQHAG